MAPSASAEGAMQCIVIKLLSRRRRVKKVWDGFCGGLPQKGDAKSGALKDLYPKQDQISAQKAGGQQDGVVIGAGKRRVDGLHRRQLHVG